METITWFCSGNSQHVGMGRCEGVEEKSEVRRSTKKLLGVLERHGDCLNCKKSI